MLEAANELHVYEHTQLVTGNTSSGWLHTIAKLCRHDHIRTPCVRAEGRAPDKQCQRRRHCHIDPPLKSALKSPNDDQ